MCVLATSEQEKGEKRCVGVFQFQPIAIVSWVKMKKLVFFHWVNNNYCAHFLRLARALIAILLLNTVVLNRILLHNHRDIVVVVRRRNERTPRKCPFSSFVLPRFLARIRWA